MSKIIIQLCLLILSITLIHSKTIEEFLSCIKDQIGKEYIKGAEGPDNFDDSGLIYYCSDKQIPRNINDQFRGGKRNDYGVPGALVFFGKKNEDPIHVGVCLGENVMIHAPGPGQNIFYLNYKSSHLYSFKGYRQYFRGSFSGRQYIVDVNFYRTKYSDLKNFNDYDAYLHFFRYGYKEGRSPSLFYDPKFYVDNYPDLKKAFGSDWGKLFEHFYDYGIDEHRNSSPLYYPDYYRKKYPDLKNLDERSLFMHFTNNGIKEGRQASPNFDLATYMVKNPDLVKAFGNDLKQYYYHYLIYGINEGRPK